MSTIVLLKINHDMTLCIETDSSISIQCKSAADKVMNHVGIPNVLSLANTSYNFILPISWRSSDVSF